MVIVQDANFVEAMLLLRRLFTGTMHRAKNAKTLQTRELTIRRPAAGPAHLDGAPVQLPALLNMRVVPSSLRLLVPDGAKLI